jgi:hypothetical protein
MSRRVLAILLLVAGCTAERQVLDNPAGVVTTCDEAWSAAAGAACALPDRCERATPGDATCCTDVATCMPAGLVLDQSCRPECNCTSDAACTFGAQICRGHCVACPPTDLCPPCPDGWVALERNGCATCQCGPPPQCDTPEASCAPDDPNRVCYAGASCASGCDAAVPGCCSNACAARGCTGPAPLGCVSSTCAPGNGCAVCATTSCTCVDTRWVCEAACVGQVTLSCTYSAQ